MTSCSLNLNIFLLNCWNFIHTPHDYTLWWQNALHSWNTEFRKIKTENTQFGRKLERFFFLGPTVCNSQFCLLHFHHNRAEVLEVMRVCYSLLICEFDMVHLSCGLEADLRQGAKHEEIWWLARGDISADWSLLALLSELQRVLLLDTSI